METFKLCYGAKKLPPWVRHENSNLTLKHPKTQSLFLGNNLSLIIFSNETIGKFVIALINFDWGKENFDVIVIVYILYNSKGWVKCGSKLVAWFRGDEGKNSRSQALWSDWIKKVCSGLPDNSFLNMSQTVTYVTFITRPGKSLGLIGLCLCSYLYNAN